MRLERHEDLGALLRALVTGKAASSSAEESPAASLARLGLDSLEVVELMVELGFAVDDDGDRPSPPPGPGRPARP